MNQPDQSAPHPSRANRSVKHLLLDTRFQLKYTAMIVTVAAMLSIFLGSFLFSKVQENSRILGLEALGDPLFQAQIEAADQELFWMIALSILGFMLVVTALSLLITHRMAGPIYVMKRHLMSLAQGALPQIRELRKGDEFAEFYEKLTEAFLAIEQRTTEEKQVLSRAIAVLSDVQESQILSVRNELQVLLTQKEVLLRPRARL